MIVLDGVTKSYHTRAGPKHVLRGIDFSISKGEKVGFLGRNGAGKSTLIRIISGAELPDSGSVTRTMSVSWPLAFWRRLPECADRGRQSALHMPHLWRGSGGQA